MKKLFLLAVLFLSGVLNAFEINEETVKKIPEKAKYPCPSSRYVLSYCEVKVDPGLGEGEPVRRRDQIAIARKLCLSFPSLGEKEFSSREADGDGIVFVCRFNREDFLRWWTKETYLLTQGE